jgi:hypothetical protein
MNAAARESRQAAAGAAGRRAVPNDGCSARGTRTSWGRGVGGATKRQHSSSAAYSCCAPNRDAARASAPAYRPGVVHCNGRARCATAALPRTHSAKTAEKKRLVSADGTAPALKLRAQREKAKGLTIKTLSPVLRRNRIAEKRRVAQLAAARNKGAHLPQGSGLGRGWGGVGDVLRERFGQGSPTFQRGMNTKTYLMRVRNGLLSHHNSLLTRSLMPRPRKGDTSAPRAA